MQARSDAGQAAISSLFDPDQGRFLWNRHDEKMKGFSVHYTRRLLCALVAAIFATAAQPGAMAMPSASPSSMTAPQAAMPGCDSMNHHKDRTPAKSSVPCAGMFSCLGVAALLLQPIDFRSPVAHLVAHQPGSLPHGLSQPPENPPPIA